MVETDSLTGALVMAQIQLRRREAVSSAVRQLTLLRSAPENVESFKLPRAGTVEKLERGFVPAISK